MGIFYNPPQPPTANSGGTTPEPHVPVGSQGAQPPRYSTALMLVAVLASYPLDLEPRPVLHNLSQRKIAPLTLSYGSQPPVIGTQQVTRQTIFSNWPIDLEPRLFAPNERQQKIAPLTLVYGSQPPVVGTAAVSQQTVINSWPLNLEPRLGLPNSTQQKIAPLTLIYGSEPPRYSIAARMSAMSSAWTDISLVAPKVTQSAAFNQVTFVPSVIQQRVIWDAWVEVTQIRPSLVNIAPLTLAYGSQPPVIGNARERATLINSWPADLEPRLSSPNNVRQTIAPLTLVYGDQPPRVLNAGLLTGLVASWQDTSQFFKTSVQSAAINIVSFVPSAAQQKVIWAAWADVSQIRPSLVNIAPLTLVYGQQPPVVGNTQVTRSLLVNSWPSDLEPRLSVPNNRQQTIVPLTLTYGDQPPVNRARIVNVTLINSWPADLEPRLGQPNNRQQTIAPLTLVYGDQPSRRAPLSVVDTVKLATAWDITWSAQTASPNASWNAPPVLALIPYRPLSRTILVAWEPPFVKPPVPVSIAPLTLIYGSEPPRITNARLLAQFSAAWKDAPFFIDGPIQSAAFNAVQFVPALFLQRTIWSAWVDTFVSLPTLENIAPLTLVYGDQPPRQRISTIVLSSWSQEQLAIQVLRQTASWNFQQQVPYRTLPLSIRASWEESFISIPRLVQNASTNSIVFVPFNAAPYGILYSWQPEQIDFLRRGNFAPLTLVYGDQPTPRLITDFSKLVAAWAQVEAFTPIRPVEAAGTFLFDNGPIIVRFTAESINQGSIISELIERGAILIESIEGGQITGESITGGDVASESFAVGHIINESII